MRFALDLFYVLGSVLTAPWLAWRWLKQRGWRAGARGPVDAPTGVIWLHGSSVGEVSLIRPLVELLERRRPGVPIAISSHTATGVESARRAYPRHSVFRLPLDFSWLQRRLVRRLNPVLIVIVESDFWPNHLLAARHAGVPVAVVNGKLSERSVRLHRWSRLVPRALGAVALFAVQTGTHAARFSAIGIPAGRIVVTGNMKYDLTADDAESGLRSALRARLGFDDSDIVILGGSLHPGEDLDLLAACSSVAGDGPRTRLVIVPRYPDQAPAVIDNVSRSGLEAIAKSAIDREPGLARDGTPVIVVDTLGELRQLYAAADIAFVGGSLYYRGANKGGHNLMEPAILGLPVLFGPFNFSFRETVADLLAADAGLLVHDRDELTRCLAELTASAARRAELGRRAREVVLNGQGASARNLELLLPLMDRAPGCSGSKDDAQCRHQTSSHLLNE